MSNYVSKVLSAENTFCDPIYIAGKTSGTYAGYFVLTIAGTFVGVLTLQRTIDNGVTWLDVENYPGNIVDNGFEVEGALYRIGFKTGGFTSGSATVRIAS